MNQWLKRIEIFFRQFGQLGFTLTQTLKPLFETHVFLNNLIHKLFHSHLYFGSISHSRLLYCVFKYLWLIFKPNLSHFLHFSYKNTHKCKLLNTKSVRVKVLKLRVSTKASWKVQLHNKSKILWLWECLLKLYS